MFLSRGLSMSCLLLEQNSLSYPSKSACCGIGGEREYSKKIMQRGSLSLHLSWVEASSPFPSLAGPAVISGNARHSHHSLGSFPFHCPSGEQDSC